MMKKTYVPMTVEHEAFVLNQAIAGDCRYVPMNNGDPAACEDCCDALDRYGYHDQHHSWEVYGKLTPAGEWANDAIGISIGDAEAYGRGGAYTSSCYTSPSGKVTNGAAVRQTSNVRVGYFDPCHEDQSIEYVYDWDWAAAAAASGDAIIFNSVS